MTRRNFIKSVLCTGIIAICILICMFELWKYTEESVYLQSLIKTAKESPEPRALEIEKKFDLSDLEKKLDERLKIAAQTPMTILTWEPEFGIRSAKSVNKTECGNCDFTYDKSKITDQNTKAVIFHVVELHWTSMPTFRRDDQFYVYYTMESSATVLYWYGSYRRFDDMFNLTMTYRLDSDVFAPYAIPSLLTKEVQASKIPIEDLIKKKKKLALWVVSNCAMFKGSVIRRKYIQRLTEAGLQVDIGGKCFRNSIKDWNYEDYKFYFSFENSYHCKDYVTEKLYRNALAHGVVPVVFGSYRHDYEMLTPPNSFIFAKDYTDNELVRYLNYLDKHDDVYMKYLKWREIPLNKYADNRRATGHCQLCRIMHGINYDNIFNDVYEQSLKEVALFEKSPKPRIIKSLDEWFYGKENRDCLVETYDLKEWAYYEMEWKISSYPDYFIILIAVIFAVIYLALKKRLPGCHFLSKK